MSDSSQSEAPAQASSQSDMWGLTAALGNWGFGGLTTNEATAEEQESSEEKKDATTENVAKLASDAELAAMENEMDSVAAAAAMAVTSAIWSSLETLKTTTTTTTAAAENREDATTAATTEAEVPLSDAELAAMENEIDSAAAAAQTAVSSAIWSSLETLSEFTASKPAAWIEELEREHTEKDPNHKLRQSLDVFVELHPRATYEEWVEELLVKEGWDDGSAVVDNSFYAEKSSHRNLWNERNMQDGIGVEEAETKRAYVLASESSKGKKKRRSVVVDDKAEEIVVEDQEEEIVFETIEHPATQTNELDPDDLDLDALLA
jgi:hypothetical protein